MAYSLIMNKKYNQSYNGPAEWCHWEFEVNLPDQCGASWTAQQSLNAHIQELQDNGSYILEYRLWEDKSPMLTTKYLVEVVATSEGVGRIAALPWAAIIIGVIIIIGLLVTYYIVRETGSIVEYVGETSPITLPLIAAAGVGLVVLGILLFRQPSREKGG